MYIQHFGLTRYPFGKSLKPDELFDAHSTREAAARLQHLIELRGIGLLTGEPGSGKTTACRKLIDGLHDGLYRVFYVPLSTGNVMDAYKSIAWEMGLPTERSRSACYRVIRAEVTRLCVENNKTPILIVDEAHHLRNDVLEDLRLLTNYELDSVNRLCLLLVGLPEIRRRVSMTLHESLEQRIVMKHHIGALEREELDGYLSHHLNLAGTELPLFAPDATEALYQATLGLPRNINRLGHYALMAAAAQGKKSVVAEHVESASCELGR
jgi:type II secretory pathway predicted ATPase ExeA